MTTLSRILIGGLILVVGACGDDDGPAPQIDTGPVIVYDGGDDIDAGGNPVCLVDEDLGDLGALDPGAQAASGQALSSTTRFMSWTGAVAGDDQASDQVQVELYEGLGAMTTGFGPGTYMITTATDRQYRTCGLCIRVFADRDPDGDFDVEYLAQSGTLVLTEVPTADGETLAGSIENAEFVEVDIAYPNEGGDYTSTIVSGGCTVSLANLEFSAPITEFKKTVGGKGPTPGPTRR